MDMLVCCQSMAEMVMTEYSCINASSFNQIMVRCAGSFEVDMKSGQGWLDTLILVSNDLQFLLHALNHDFKLCADLIIENVDVLQFIFGQFEQICA